MAAIKIISLPKPSGNRYYRPLVVYQLRQKGVDLSDHDCGGDIKGALSKLNGATCTGTANNAEGNLTPKDIAFLVWNGYQKDDIFEKYITLLEWCSSQKTNIKIYYVDRETGKLKDAIFPNLYETTIGESDKRGLFQHGKCFEAVMPQAQSNDNNEVNSTEFIALWKKFREDRKNIQQKCAICLNITKLSNSHIIPESILRMADTLFYSLNKELNPKKLTENLLCNSQSLDSKSKYEEGCEQMLSSVEQKLVEFLAGPEWKKTDGPGDVSGGLIFDFQEAVKQKSTVKFTITMKVWHALISIAYRVLITWTGEPTENSLGEKITAEQINRMEESLGRLAEALHCLTIYPYDEPTVCVWLLLSPNGAKAIENRNTELYVRQVVPHGDNEVSMFIHFGIRGLHFIVTDLSDDCVETLTCDEQQCVIPLIPDQEFNVIPYSHFEQNGKLLKELMGAYDYIVNRNALASSMKVTRNNTSELPEISGDVVRLPSGFEYSNGELQLARNWKECYKKDIRKRISDSICEKMWIVKSPNEKLNAVFAFTEGQYFLVFGYSLSSEGKIGGPMVGTKHKGTPVNLIINRDDLIDFIETVIQQHWECINEHLH